MPPENTNKTPADPHKEEPVRWSYFPEETTTSTQPNQTYVAPYPPSIEAPPPIINTPTPQAVTPEKKMRTTELFIGILVNVVAAIILATGGWLYYNYTQAVSKNGYEARELVQKAGQKLLTFNIRSTDINITTYSFTTTAEIENVASTAQDNFRKYTTLAANLEDNPIMKEDDIKSSYATFSQKQRSYTKTVENIISTYGALTPLYADCGTTIKNAVGTAIITSIEACRDSLEEVPGQNITDKNQKVFYDAYLKHTTTVLSIYNDVAGKELTSEQLKKITLSGDLLKATGKTQQLAIQKALKSSYPLDELEALAEKLALKYPRQD